MRFYLLLFLAIQSYAVGEPLSSHEVAVVQSKKIDENSGIDLSYRYPGTVWTHNDSGGKPYLFLVSLKTGETLATISLKGAVNRDWEDLVTYQKDGKSYIAIADVGDNLKFRKDYQIYIIEEPLLKINDKDNSPEVVEIIKWTNIRYTYDDGSRNCEAVAIDLSNQQLILIEKVRPSVDGTTGVYRLDISGENRLDAKAKRIAHLPSINFSAMDISDDGSTLLARAYHAGFIFRKAIDETWEQVLAKPIPKPIIFPMQRQGEGVCFTTDGKSVLISTEKKRQPIFQVKLPEVAPQ